MEEHEVQFEYHYQLMREILWSSKFTGRIIDKIRWKIDILMVYINDIIDYDDYDELHRLTTATKEFALARIWHKYVTEKPYLRYTDRYSLSTYISRTVNYMLTKILRSYEPHNVAKEDPLTGKKKITEWKKFGGDVLNNRYKRFRISPEIIDHLVDPANNPESLLIFKDCIEKFFSKDELNKINSGEYEYLDERRIFEFKSYWEKS